MLATMFLGTAGSAMPVEEAVAMVGAKYPFCRKSAPRCPDNERCCMRYADPGEVSGERLYEVCVPAADFDKLCDQTRGLKEEVLGAIATSASLDSPADFVATLTATRRSAQSTCTTTPAATKPLPRLGTAATTSRYTHFNRPISDVKTSTYTWPQQMVLGGIGEGVETLRNMLNPVRDSEPLMGADHRGGPQPIHALVKWAVADINANHLPAGTPPLTVSQMIWNRTIRRTRERAYGAIIEFYMRLDDPEKLRHALYTERHG